MAATTAVHGSPRAWTITFTIPRPPRIRWGWLTVAMVIVGAVFVTAVTVAGVRQSYTPTRPGPVGPMPCHSGGAGTGDLGPVADPAPLCPTIP